MGCPQCGSMNIEKDGVRENYNMIKGMAGQAIGGTVGSLAGFENQDVWKCTSCGCRFVEGFNKEKIISRGITKDLYYDLGNERITVNGNQGFSYTVKGIHLDVSQNGVRKNHFEIPTFERVEYKLNPPTLILNYLCNDGRVRRKCYLDLSKNDLEKLVNAMRASLTAFHKDSNYDFIMHGKKETQIVEIKENVLTYEQQQKKSRLILSGVISAAVGLYVGISAGDMLAFFVVGAIAFPIAYITLALQKKQ